LFDSEDDYGRLLGLANAYELACYDDHPIAKGLYYAALDNFYADRAPETPAYVTSLPAKDAEELQQLLTSSQARRRTWETHRDCALELLRTLTVSGEALRNIRGRITLIHGKDDPVIHSSETLALAQSLRNAGRSPQVLVSPLLGHGDPELRWNDLLQAPALIRTFAGFFSDIRTRSTT
jgi:pimeloyl-ACP methyl ester carboxylesterase